ncbi:MAG: hypothetical protein IIZ06_02690 [Kiritimatiellae bacterium]|nr:hypothetical protein [Kiritimatiellia bacterium]
MTTALVQILRIVAVVALLCASAALATPPGRLPLALRGLAKMLGRRSAADGGGEGRVSAGRRFAAFLALLAAVALAVM